MGTASSYSDPDWYYGPKHVEIIALPPLDHGSYFDGNIRIHQSWDFENSKICKWLEENCKGKYNYVWGIELEDDRMIVHVGFVIEKHVKAFKEKFETLDWNMEDDSRIPMDVEVHNLFYSLEEYNDKGYERAVEVAQWCRENLHGFWKYQHTLTGINFYFRHESDAAAFKLRFL